MATNNSTVGTCPSPCGDTPLGTTASIIGIWTFANTLLVAVLTTVASLSTVYDRVIDCSRSLEKELDQTNWLIHKGRDMFENLSSTLPYEESALSRRQLEELDRAAKSGVESYKKQLQGRPRFPAWNRRRRALLSLIFISRGTADELEKRLSALKEARLSFEDSAKGLIPGLFAPQEDAFRHWQSDAMERIERRMSILMTRMDRIERVQSGVSVGIEAEDIQKLDTTTKEENL